MIRSEIQRAEFKRVTPAKEPKRRMKVCEFRDCHVRFERKSEDHRCCCPEHAEQVVVAERMQRERKERQEGLRKLKTRADHIADAQRAFNAFIRERDKDQPCICCGRTGHKVHGLRSHGWDCGHFRSVGSAPHMRFMEDNAHRQLVYCNRDRAGNGSDYRIGLIARIGLARVEALEADQTPRKWSIEELQEIKAHYRAKLKHLKGKS